MLIEIPALLCDAGIASAALVAVSGAIAAGVTMIDYAFDRVKQREN